MPAISDFSDGEHDMDVDINIEQKEIDDLMKLLPFDDLLSVEEYIYIDKDEPLEQLTIDDDDIIQSIKKDQQDDQDKEEQPYTSVSLSNALVSINTLYDFLIHPPLDFNIESDDLKVVKKLRKNILGYKKSLAKQVSLDEYFVFE